LLPNLSVVETGKRNFPVQLLPRYYGKIIEDTVEGKLKGQPFNSTLTVEHPGRDSLFKPASLILAFGVVEPCRRLRQEGGALFEPFGKAQDRLREFAPPPESANRAENPKGPTGQPGFWVLLPKHKDLVRGAKPRGFQKFFVHFSMINSASG
jgi:hypothetical protein